MSFSLYVNMAGFTQTVTYGTLSVCLSACHINIFQLEVGGIGKYLTTVFWKQMLQYN